MTNTDLVGSILPASHSIFLLLHTPFLFGAGIWWWFHGIQDLYMVDRIEFTDWV